MTIRGCIGWVAAAILAVLLVLSLLFAAALFAPKAFGDVPPRQSISVPLVDRDALAAHADSAGVPRAGAYALAWMESRDGRCLPRCPRGQGVFTKDTATGARRHICREVGRMQINPCAGLERGNPRCAFQRVLHNVDDNYACGMWYYRTRIDRYGTQVKALASYNGGNPAYAKDALAKTGEWWFAGFLTEEDR